MENVHLWLDAIFPKNVFNLRSADSTMVRNGFWAIVMLILVGAITTSYGLLLAVDAIAMAVSNTDIISHAVAADVTHVASVASLEPTAILDTVQAAQVLSPESIDLSTHVSTVTQQASASADIISQQEYSEVLAKYKAGNLNYSFG